MGTRWSVAASRGPGASRGTFRATEVGPTLKANLPKMGFMNATIMCRLKKYAALGACPFVVTTVSAAAAFVPVTTDRFVENEASVSAQVGPTGFEALIRRGPSTGLWMETVDSEFSNPFGLRGGGFASQTSNIEPTAISCTQLARARRQRTVSSSFGNASGRGRSMFDLTFDVSEPVWVQYAASVMLTPFTPDWGLNVTWTGPGFFINSQPAVAGGPEQASFEGWLQPGRYRIFVQSEVILRERGSFAPFTEVNAQAQFDLRVVPSPSTSGLLLLAGATTLRRRKR